MTLAYRFRAARADGSIERGAIEVPDRASAVAQLHARGLLPIEVTASPFSASRLRLAGQDLAVGLRTLATLLGSGLSLARTLAAFEEVAPSSWTPGIPVIRERIRQGDSLSIALERSALGIPSVAIGVIRAGERGSGLASAVERAAEIAEASAQLRSSIRNSLAYPAVLAVTGTLSLAVIVGAVLPRFAIIVSDVGATLPPLARATLAAGNLAALLAVPGLILIVILAVGWTKWVQHEGGRTQWHRWMATLPFVGELRLCAASSRSCSALAALLESGVPIASALQHAARACGDAWIEGQVLAARERVIAGAPLSAALAGERAVTTTARRMIRAGEESGQLAAMLKRAAELDGVRLSARLRTLVRLIEPVLIVVFAGVVALVAAALLQAVYSVRPG